MLVHRGCAARRVLVGLAHDPKRCTEDAMKKIINKKVRVLGI